MRTAFASFLTVAVTVALAACGDDGDGTEIDARRIDAAVDGPEIDAPIDAPDIDAPDIDAPIDAPAIDAPIDAPIDAAIDAPIDAPAIDAPIDAPPTPSELIGFARAATGAVNLPIMDATITYVKPAVGNPANDPAGFTIQVLQAGPALMVAVDPATLTPAPAVGDVVSFTITNIAVTGGQPRATAITGYTRSATGANVGALAQDVSAAADLLTAIDNYDSEIIDVTGTITGTFGSSGSGFERAQINTAGMTAADPNFQLRVPATFRDANDLVMGCAFTLNNTPVGRFNTQTQLAAFVAADLALTDCPNPTLLAAVALSATSVQLTFSRNVMASSVMPDGSQFTFDNGLTASAATANGRTVTVTTSIQTNGTLYLATAGAGITDLLGAPLASNTTMFTGFMSPTHLVINEVDYNQNGNPDLASFIEIYNPTPVAQPLANLSITYLNGNGNIEYGTRVALTASTLTELPAGGYLVIRNNTVVVPVGVATIDVTGDFIQNGPDAIALINTSTNTLVDALSYGSPALTSVTIAGFAAMVSMVEGPTAFTGVDTNDDLNSLARVPNGIDTNMASTDWLVRNPETPGAAN